LSYLTVQTCENIYSLDCSLAAKAISFQVAASFLLVLASVYAVPVQVVNQGPQSGPLTALYAGDLIQTPRGLAPLSLEGFSEDVDEDGFVDPIADAAPAVAAPAATVQYAAAPAVQYAAAPALQYAAIPTLQYAAAPAVQYGYAAAPAATVQYSAAPAVQYAAAPAAAVQYAYNYPSVYGAGAGVTQTWATGKITLK
jgi:hypothetical protein